MSRKNNRRKEIYNFILTFLLICMAGGQEKIHFAHGMTHWSDGNVVSFIDGESDSSIFSSKILTNGDTVTIRIVFNPKDYWSVGQLIAQCFPAFECLNNKAKRKYFEALKKADIEFVKLRFDGDNVYVKKLGGL